MQLELNIKCLNIRRLPGELMAVSYFYSLNWQKFVLCVKGEETLHYAKICV